MYTYELKLMKSFPRSFINANGEFIALSKENEFFNIENCGDEFAVKCKVLEWFSRGAFKTDHYSTAKRNGVYHKFMLDGINAFLGTSFSFENMKIIYTELGNGVNRVLCEKFVNSGYDMAILKRE